VVGEDGSLVIHPHLPIIQEGLAVDDDGPLCTRQSFHFQNRVAKFLSIQKQIYFTTLPKTQKVPFWVFD
jgi:hypothetical protein